MAKVLHYLFGLDPAPFAVDGVRVRELCVDGVLGVLLKPGCDATYQDFINGADVKVNDPDRSYVL